MQASSSTTRRARAPSCARRSRLGDDQTLVFEGEGFAAGDRVKAVVPWTVRFPTMANHTATHLLHESLRRVLGEHVQQAGSAVRPDKLRFDFTHEQALTAEERAQVEELVNEQVFAGRRRADLRDADRRGPPARRADALRREVRRHRPRRRDRRLLARALRRHARALDRRDRAVRDPLRGLGRLRRAPDRGGHLGRGVRAPARARAGGRRAAHRAGAGAQAGEAGRRRHGRGRLHRHARDRGGRRHRARGRRQERRPARRLRQAEGTVTRRRR